MTAEFGADYLVLLRAIQDRLIPRDGVMPSGGEGEAPTIVVERSATSGADRLALVEVLEAVAAAATVPFAQLQDGARDALLRDVERRHSAAFTALVRQTYLAYYTQASVQAAIGSGPPQPAGFALEAFDSSLLDRVRRTAKPWRE